MAASTNHVNWDLMEKVRDLNVGSVIVMKSPSDPEQGVAYMRFAEGWINADVENEPYPSDMFFYADGFDSLEIIFEA